MPNSLEYAQEAAQHGNWSQTSYWLQQLLVERAVQSLSEEELTRLLILALMVLEAGEFQDRWDIAKVIPRFGEAAIAPLVALVQNETSDLEACWFATRILGEFDSPIAIGVLVEVLEQSEDDELSQMAATALANLGTSAVSALDALLEDAQTRPLAVRALSQIRVSATIDPLLKVVRDPQPAIRAMAIESLSSFHDPRIPSVLVAALEDHSAAVRQAALAGLAVRSDLEASLDLVNLLSRHLCDINLDVCLQAATGLGRIGSDAAVEALFQALKPELPVPLQLEIVRAFGWAGTAIAMDHLQQVFTLLGQSQAALAVYQEAVTILGRWAKTDLKPQAAQILINVLTSKHISVTQPGIKQLIAVGLGQLQQKQALEPLMQLLADEDLGVKLHAIAALKTLDPQTAHARLENLKHQSDVPDALKQGVAIALREW